MASNKHYQELLELFLSINTEKEADLLLRDMFTPQEIDALCERWQLIQRLHEGMSQRDIAKELQISVGTVTRGSRALQYGAGGFEYFLKKLHKTKK